VALLGQNSQRHTSLFDCKLYVFTTP